MDILLASSKNSEVTVAPVYSSLRQAKSGSRHQPQRMINGKVWNFVLDFMTIAPYS